jgi:hypothetical protein
MLEKWTTYFSSILKQGNKKMQLQWGMKLRDLVGSRWDVFNRLFKKYLSWDQFKEFSSLHNNNLCRKSGWTFSKDQSYIMPIIDDNRAEIKKIIEAPVDPSVQTDSGQGHDPIDNINSQQIKKGIVNASYLRFRIKPGGECIKYLHHEMVVDIIETFPKWLRVRVDSQEGFVFRKYIIWEDDIERESQPEEISEEISEELSEELTDFHGDLDWIHNKEGHNGKPYWPKGLSGITIDPGVDLGHCDYPSIQKCYQKIFSHEQMAEVAEIAKLKLKGIAANEYLRNQANENFRNIRITRTQAKHVFPFLARPYWKKITTRFPKLLDSDVPGVVQTVMLSIAYNRGPYNKDLNILGETIQNKEWQKLARIIRNMQQNHREIGIRKRRRSEAHYILQHV